MKILVTGAYGFIGQNLCAALREIANGHDRRADHTLESAPEVLRFGRGDTQETLDAYCADCDFVFHLAGVNRPETEAEFAEGNRDLTARVLETLEAHGNRCAVLLASSAQAARDNAYGRSKRAAEELAFAHAERTGAAAYVYRLPNVFGKWCRPNYNSAIATFCHNTANGLPIQVNDPNYPMRVVYIDDVIEEFIQALRGGATRAESGYCLIPVCYETTLGHIAETILSFPELRDKQEVPDFSDLLTKKLYSTYLSYLPPERFASGAEMKTDERGSFTELLHLGNRGQVSVNITTPGVTKGEHWHHTKNEKFIVVHGEALIRERRIGLQKDGTPYPVHEFRVSGEHIQEVEMIPGYTHSITNLSDTDELVTVMWANETFDPDKPDTFFEKV